MNWMSKKIQQVAPSYHRDCSLQPFTIDPYKFSFVQLHPHIIGITFCNIMFEPEFNICPLVAASYHRHCPLQLGICYERTESYPALQPRIIGIALGPYNICADRLGITKLQSHIIDKVLFDHTGKLTAEEIEYRCSLISLTRCSLTIKSRKK